MFIVPISGLEPMLGPDKTAAAGQKGIGAGLPFADVLDKAVTELEQAQAASRKDAYDLSMGRVDNLWEVMVNSQRVATANSLVTQLTTRAVGAYKEIMQMQV